MRIAQMAEEAGEAAGLICVRTWPEVEAALQAQGFGKPRFLDMELSEMMWHGPCPVTGAGPDCARFGPGDDLMFVRKQAANGRAPSWPRAFTVATSTGAVSTMPLGGNTSKRSAARA